MKECETEIKLTQREKEIIEAGIEYTMKNRPNMLAGDRFSEEMKRFNRNKHFEKGAKWADKTMIDKACEWIEKNKHQYKVLSFGSLSTDWSKFIREFRKAMGGG